eukprot:CAMPEP_0118851794 /NCGR_PEP_ID=MMETSP1163-20130328/1098_1 /TAXON_ID=124430 /ORGANISM="Phaeomonas parva, Strain CCMP2877" /LENGTH=1103 /DNA_ID=CAMNT_0006784183 /DNA_START=134 /DNA_END=3445 /DNA_ORIENTATION=+
MAPLRALGLLALLGVSSTAALDIKAASPENYVDDKLNVHIVPHTHDDVGWLKTVDQYFYGANNTIQHAGVQHVLDSVFAELKRKPERRFTYVEMAFFARWYTQLAADEKDEVRSLVKDGRLTFANGGWCMHDEATTHYVGMLDQTTLGHRFLKKEFGFAPRVGWQLDPFGHSATQASLLTYDIGFDALFFGRIDYQDRERRQAEKQCEGVWEASKSAGSTNRIFWGLTGSYGGSYGPPAGFDFDIKNDNAVPIMDDERLADYNVESRVNDFVSTSLKQGAMTQGSHILMTMGSDFNYEGAANYFKNLDKLINYVNKDGRVNVFYSTPEDYMLAKHLEINECAPSCNFPKDISYDVKTDDFFPYSDCEDCFWAGYFTSRVNLKKLERDMSSYLLMGRQLEVLANLGVMKGLPAGSDGPLRALEEASSLAQHHDAVSGTSKQHVAEDYAMRLARGHALASPMVTEAVQILTGLGPEVDVFECPLANVSVCAPTTALADKGFDVFVYNPLAQSRTSMVQVPVSHATYKVLDAATGDEVPAEVVRNQMPDMNGALPHGASAPQLWTLFFQAQHVGPLGFRKYTIVKSTTQETPRTMTTRKLKTVGGGVRRRMADEFTIKNDKVTLTFNENTGKLTRVSTVSGVDAAVNQGFYYYTGFDSGLVDMDLGDCDPATGKGCPKQYSAEVLAHHKWMQSLTPQQMHNDMADRHHGDASGSSQNSGAYIFRPQEASQKPKDVAFAGSIPEVIVHEGFLVSEVVQHWTPWLNQTIRIYSGSADVDFEWTIGSIPIEDGVGKEIISRFDTDVVSSGVFYTDSNGREFQQRKQNYRPTWDLRVYQPVSGNYYPVNSAVYVEDTNKRVSLLTDRSQGGSSLGKTGSGSIELMVARRLLVDDSRGVGEPLNETVWVSPYVGGECDGCRYGPGITSRGTHRMVLESPKKDGLSATRAGAEAMFSPMEFFVTEHTEYDAATGSWHPHAAQERARSRDPVMALPDNVKLLTLQALGANEILVRMAHIFAVGEHAELSLPAQVDLEAFISSMSLRIVSAEEVSLTTNRRIDEVQHLNWLGAATATEEEAAAARAAGVFGDGEANIVLQPMEIRAGVLMVEPL